MAVMLPGALVEALNICGFNWPSTNEDQLWEWGSQVRSLAATTPTLRQAVEEALADPSRVNQGPAAQAFARHLQREDSPLETLDDFANLANAIGVGANGVAVLVVGLKILVIGQLIMLAISIATAIASAGVGSLGIPAVKKAAEIAVEQAIEQIIDQILNSE